MSGHSVFDRASGLTRSLELEGAVPLSINRVSPYGRMRYAVIANNLAATAMLDPIAKTKSTS